MAAWLYAIPGRFRLVFVGLSIAALVLSPALTPERVGATERQAPPSGQLVIRVVASNGQPLDAIVVVQGTYSMTGRTDGQGFYRASVPAGVYLVSALYGSVSTRTRQVTVVSGRTRRVSLPLNASTVAAASPSQQPTMSSLPALTAPQAGAAALQGFKGAPSGGSGDGAASGSTFTTKTSGPHKIKSLKADPGTTEPSGSSRITAVIDNPTGTPLTYAWTATGGKISGQGSQATWVAPAYAGAFTVSLTVSDSKKRTASASVAVQAVDASAEPAPAPEPPPSTSEPPATSGTRNPTAWPFATTSSWNYPIGSGAQYETVRASTGTGIRGGSANINQYSIPTYVAAASDPVRNVYDTSSGSRVLKATIRVSTAARPAQGTDGHLNLIDETHTYVHELYHAKIESDGSLTTWKHNKNDLRLNGAGFSMWHGSVAAGTSSLGGMIRRTELSMGTGGLQTGIRHALQAAFYPASLNRYAPGGRSFVWPASSSDNPAGYGTVGNVHMGSLLAIPYWVNVNALGITDPQVLEIARALQNFGAYIVDGGNIGSNNVVIRIDPQAAGEIANRITFDAQIAIPMRQLQVVMNSHLNGFAPTVPGGGGVPLQPLAPDLAAAALITGSPVLASLGPRGFVGPAVTQFLIFAMWIPFRRRKIR